MIVTFKSKKFLKECSDPRAMIKAFGAEMSKKLQQRLMELKAAEVLSDISHLPPARCHELVNKKGMFSVDLVYPYRLVFRPADEPIPLKADGGIDLDCVKTVLIIAKEDTHDEKFKSRK